VPGPTVTLTFAGDAKKLDKTMQGVGDGARKMASEVGKASDQMAAGAEGGSKRFAGSLGKLKTVAAAGGAAAGAGLTLAFAKSMEFGAAQQRLEAQLGAGSAASEQAGNVAGALYADAFGESFADVGEAVKTVMQSGIAGIGATDQQVQALTGNVMSLSDAFGQDLNGTVNAVGQMMRTGLAKNGQEALDVLTVGFQQGNDKAGDLLDTFNEYGTQFRKVGLDGKTAMGLISQGLKAGARDADIVADSIKEFSIRAIDGSKSTVAGFTRLGLSARKMADDVAAGGPRASAALGLTLDKLRAIKDPTERAAIAVQLFGTQAEDMGDALYALDLDTAAQGIGSVDGAAQKLNDTLGDTAQNKIESVKRKVEEWGASLVEVKGPIGTAGAMIAAFGPQALSTLAPLASMLAALRMQGAVSALSGVGAQVDAVGTKADVAATKSGKLKGALKGIGVGLALGAVAYGMDQINAASEEGNLSGWNGQLHDLTRVMTGDWGNALSDMGAQLDQWKRNLQAGFNTDGSSNIGKFFGWLRQQMNEPLPPLQFDVNTGPAVGQVDGFIADVNSRTPQVNINGNTNGAGFALRTILDEIAAGHESVVIDGRPIPAQEALRYVLGLINNSAGTTTINGQNRPAGDALADILRRTNASSASIGVGANTGSAQGTVQAFVNRWNGYTIQLKAGVTSISNHALQGYAAGGPVVGPGSGTSDTAGLFALSNGEYVATAKQVANAGGPEAFGRLMSMLDRGPMRGFASGGPVMSVPSSSAPAAAGGAGVMRVQLVASGGLDSAAGSFIAGLIRTGKLQLRAA